MDWAMIIGAVEYFSAFAGMALLLNYLCPAP
jgi:hypothetical protein